MLFVTTKDGVSDFLWTMADSMWWKIESYSLPGMDGFFHSVGNIRIFTEIDARLFTDWRNQRGTLKTLCRFSYRSDLVHPYALTSHQCTSNISTWIGIHHLSLQIEKFPHLYLRNHYILEIRGVTTLKFRWNHSPTSMIAVLHSKSIHASFPSLLSNTLSMSSDMVHLKYTVWTPNKFSMRSHPWRKQNWDFSWDSVTCTEHSFIISHWRFTHLTRY